MDRPLRILIVDDDTLVCESLALLLSKIDSMHVVGTGNNGYEALRVLKKMDAAMTMPDVVLMDIQMPEMDGIEATKRIKELYPTLKVMMLTTFKTEHNIKRALMAGAEGYLIKSVEVSTMSEKIKALFSGSIVMDPIAIGVLTQPKNVVFENLTAREYDIARLVGEGFSNKEISKYLFITEGTVRNNLSVILEKLELRDRTQLAILYLKSQ